MAARANIAKFIRDIWLPLVAVMILIAISIANSRFGWEPRPSATVGISYLILRVFLAALAGYWATYRANRRIWAAAVAGGLVFVAENVVTAAWFILLQSWADVGRVAQAVALFVWIPMIIGLIGGLIGKMRRERASAAI